MLGLWASVPTGTLKDFVDETDILLPPGFNSISLEPVDDNTFALKRKSSTTIAPVPDGLI